MKSQWHKDRIEELKHELSNNLWKLNTILTSLLAVVSIIYLVWYNTPKTIIWIIIMVALFVFTLVKAKAKANPIINNTKKINKQITNNYNILLKRKDVNSSNF